MNEAPFFVVWNPEHGLPRFRHATYQDALAEAKRLAGITKGARFYVLTACSVATMRDPVTVTGIHHMYRHQPDDEIPF